MFQTVVLLPEATRTKIMGRLGALAPSGMPKLAPAPIETGTVRCLALNLEGGGGTVAHAAAARCVQRRHQDSRRDQAVAWSAEQTAAFSLVLDQEGATIWRRRSSRARRRSA